jgi:hypothetical protein
LYLAVLAASFKVAARSASLLVAVRQAALFSEPSTDQGVNMDFGGLVLDAKKRFRGNVGSELSSRFVYLLASLSLRKLRCIGHRALAHNKRL